MTYHEINVELEEMLDAGLASFDDTELEDMVERLDELKEYISVLDYEEQEHLEELLLEVSDALEFELEERNIQ